jgi:putative protein-disulfide isomerase
LLGLFRALQHAFYVDALDTTDPEVLVDVATRMLNQADVDVSAQMYREVFESQGVKQATQDDFSIARSWGISSFPTLLLEDAGQLHILARGFTSADALQRQLSSYRSRGTVAV